MDRCRGETSYQHRSECRQGGPEEGTDREENQHQDEQAGRLGESEVSVIIYISNINPLRFNYLFGYLFNYLFQI